MLEPIIRVIDVETTGMEPPAEVIELGTCDLSLVDNVWTVGAPTSRLFGVTASPPETRAIHHIGMADVAGLPPFDPTIALDGAGIIAGHNVEFELRWLPAVAVPVLCTLKAALRVWTDAPGHSNGTLRYWLEDRGLLSLDPALAMPPHRAGPDAYVTAHVLKALLETGVTAREMAGWTREPKVMPVCPIGQHRGKPWPAVDAGFLHWMLRQPDMDPDLHWNARRELDRRASERSPAPESSIPTKDS